MVLGSITAASERAGDGRPVPALLAAAAAPLLLVLVAASILAAAAVGVHPLHPDADVTLSEAIALRNLGALVRLLDAHADMRAHYAVRPGMVREDVSLSLTPYEAAIAARRDDVVQFLERRGVHPPPEDVPRLQCLAMKVGAVNVAALLGAPPPGANCDLVQVPW